MLTPGPNRIFEYCLEDRINVVRMGQSSWVRRCCIDLLLKQIILLVNSIGRQAAKPIAFVDEVKNTNMHNNLMLTAEQCGVNESCFLRFYELKGSGHHKAGVLWCLVSILRLLMRSIVPMAGFAGSSDEVNRKLAAVLIDEMQRYLSRMQRVERFVLMSDHHFYSTVIAMYPSAESLVLQHGLIQDLRFFKPVRADALCTWSRRSADMVGDGKELVTGTYKFAINGVSDAACRSICEAKSVLICLSESKTAEAIAVRLKPFAVLQQQYGFRLLVKLHPGSLFSASELHDGIAGFADYALYKDEKIEDLRFDFAFIEQSTAVLDIACLGIPFVIINGSADSYFSDYENIAPTASNDHELIDLAVNYPFEQFVEAREKLIADEINCGECELANLIMRPAFGGGVSA